MHLLAYEAIGYSDPQLLLDLINNLITRLYKDLIIKHLPYDILYFGLKL